MLSDESGGRSQQQLVILQVDLLMDSRLKEEYKTCTYSTFEKQITKIKNVRLPMNGVVKLLSGCCFTVIDGELAD